VLREINSNKAAFLAAVMMAMASAQTCMAADHGGSSHGGGTVTRGGSFDHAGGGADRGGTSFGHGGGWVDRSSHGSVRHFDSHVITRPAEVHREFRRVEPRHDFFVHRDVDVDFHRHHFWHDFSFHRRIPTLPLGFLSLNIGGVPYYYAEGIYYQPIDGAYQEVYPPVGAAVPQPPEGSISVEAGGVTYYYAGGAFYLQQPNGTYAVAPTPLGVVVPELPPGAIQVSVGSQMAYQFNGIYYRPVFMNGVTQYETFQP